MSIATIAKTVTAIGETVASIAKSKTIANTGLSLSLPLPEGMSIAETVTTIAESVASIAKSKTIANAGLSLSLPLPDAMSIAKTVTAIAKASLGRGSGEGDSENKQDLHVES